MWHINQRWEWNFLCVSRTDHRVDYFCSRTYSKNFLGSMWFCLTCTAKKFRNSWMPACADCLAVLRDFFPKLFHRLIQPARSSCCRSHILEQRRRFAKESVLWHVLELEIWLDELGTTSKILIGTLWYGYLVWLNLIFIRLFMNIIK